ncbi:MAG TPA: type II secretion system minor pseudopilin GspI [Arenimonas sp.]|nr:type II secretion system minor pseudopilin GspI [Arenimonas sp.]
MRRSSTRGFTLLEVLIALAILALGMAAVVRTAGQQATLLRQAREHSYAQWVASNAITETRLARPLPGSGVREGEAMMGGQRWRWRMQIAATPVAGIRRLDVAVFADDRSDAVLSLTGFAGEP